MFRLRQSLLLFLTASIWGSGFVAQSVGMDLVSPVTFTFFRTLIGGIFLLPIIALLRGRRQRNGTAFKLREFLLGSLACGTCLIAAESLQQFGLVYTDVGKAGFITSMYIIFVPVISLLLGQKLRPLIILAVILATAGLYLLCVRGQLSIAFSDLLILGCAVVFAVHILVIARFVEKVDGVLLSCGQFFVASLIGLILMLLSGLPDPGDLKAAAPAILWACIMSNGVAYTLQIVGQRGMNPTVATLILSLESVMAVIFGALLLDERLSAMEGLGCALMFAAVVLAQLPERRTAGRA